MWSCRLVFEAGNGVTQAILDTIAGLPRLHVMLEDPSHLPQSSASVNAIIDRLGIGIYQGKTAYNLITLQRAASQLGVQFVFRLRSNVTANL